MFKRTTSIPAFLFLCLYSEYIDNGDDFSIFFINIYISRKYIKSLKYKLNWNKRCLLCGIRESMRGCVEYHFVLASVCIT